MNCVPRPADTGFWACLSGLLGGVLNGDTISSDVLSGFGAREVPSWCNKFAGFAGIFGFSALLAGGGNEALFVFLSDGP